MPIFYWKKLQNNTLSENKENDNSCEMRNLIETH